MQTFICNNTDTNIDRYEEIPKSFHSDLLLEILLGSWNLPHMKPLTILCQNLLFIILECIAEYWCFIIESI